MESMFVGIQYIEILDKSKKLYYYYNDGSLVSGKVEGSYSALSNIDIDGFKKVREKLTEEGFSEITHLQLFGYYTTFFKILKENYPNKFFDLDIRKILEEEYGYDQDEIKVLLTYWSLKNLTHFIALAGKVIEKVMLSESSKKILENIDKLKRKTTYRFNMDELWYEFMGKLHNFSNLVNRDLDKGEYVEMELLDKFLNTINFTSITNMSLILYWVEKGYLARSDDYSKVSINEELLKIKILKYITDRVDILKEYWIEFSLIYKRNVLYQNIYYVEELRSFLKSKKKLKLFEEEYFGYYLYFLERKGIIKTKRTTISQEIELIDYVGVKVPNKIDFEKWKTSHFEDFINKISRLNLAKELNNKFNFSKFQKTYPDIIDKMKKIFRIGDSTISPRESLIDYIFEFTKDKVSARSIVSNWDNELSLFGLRKANKDIYFYPSHSFDKYIENLGVKDFEGFFKDPPDNTLQGLINKKILTENDKTDKGLTKKTKKTSKKKTAKKTKKTSKKTAKLKEPQGEPKLDESLETLVDQMTEEIIIGGKRFKIKTIEDKLKENKHREKFDLLKGEDPLFPNFPYQSPPPKQEDPISFLSRGTLRKAKQPNKYKKAIKEFKKLFRKFLKSRRYSIEEGEKIYAIIDNEVKAEHPYVPLENLQNAIIYINRLLA
jgi:hypothetical protein